MRVFDVLDQDGKPLAIFMIDPWKRDNKNCGAWMSNLVNQAFLRGAAETSSAVYVAAVTRLQLRARKIAAFLDHLLARRHRRQMGIRFNLRHRGTGEQRQVVLIPCPAERLDRP